MQAAFVSKLFVQLCLLGLFLHLFGVPAFLRYMEEETLVLESREATGGVPAPAFTLCGREASTGTWRVAGGLEGALRECNGSGKVFSCMQGQAWGREQVVGQVQNGGERLEETRLWTADFFKSFWSCFTFNFSNRIGTHDEIFFHLNMSMLYSYYIHSPNYFLQNYNPLARVSKTMAAPTTSEINLFDLYRGPMPSEGAGNCPA